MSMAAIPRRRVRPPRLKVVGSEPRMRHRCTWSIGHLYRSVEFFSEVEWAALAEWERPTWTQWLPGVGVLAFDVITREEVLEIQEELADQQDYWRSQH